MTKPSDSEVQCVHYPRCMYLTWRVQQAVKKKRFHSVDYRKLADKTTVLAQYVVGPLTVSENKKNPQIPLSQISLSGPIHHKLKTGHHYWRHLNLNREQILSGRIHHQLKTDHRYWRYLNRNREQTLSGRIHHQLKTGHRYWRHLNLNREHTLSGRIHHQLKTGHHYWRHMNLNREQTCLAEYTIN